MTEKEQHYFEVLLEDIKHSVETVAEGHATLDEKMERFHKEAKEDHRLAMDLIKYSHDELKEEMAAGFKALGDKVDGHEERIRFLERKAA